MIANNLIKYYFFQIHTPKHSEPMGDKKIKHCKEMSYKLIIIFRFIIIIKNIPSVYANIHIDFAKYNTYFKACTSI